MGVILDFVYFMREANFWVAAVLLALVIFAFVSSQLSSSWAQDQPKAASMKAAEMLVVFVFLFLILAGGLSARLEWPWLLWPYRIFIFFFAASLLYAPMAKSKIQAASNKWPLYLTIALIQAEALAFVGELYSLF